ncbi:MAG: universal stress protein [Bacteroidales bacterium]|nr:universal stress protein [Bacteroidales bacterium]
MKKNNEIIVGIDFSECSINALKHALTIANKTNFNIVMIWVNKPDNTKAIFLSEPDKIEQIVKEQFEKLIIKYKPQLNNNSLTYVIRKGKVYQEISKLAEEDDAALIVVGTHGSSGFEEFWVGSDALKIVTASKCPVITIRLAINVKNDLKRIILPIDSSISTRQKVPFTATLARYLDAEIYVLGLYSTKVRDVRGIVDSYVNQVVGYLGKNKIRFRIDTVEADNIADAIMDYAQKNKANLISIMDVSEISTSNLWLGSYSQQMINHSPIPILTTHAKELIQVASR